MPEDDNNHDDHHCGSHLSSEISQRLLDGLVQNTVGSGTMHANDLNDHLTSLLTLKETFVVVSEKP